ncbi:hypothetical protein [uncultured Desulfobacter sp.]|uniref:hypothetical protein n=1 Tax=uncultured Desulfobacter sp. TaxID=240139 RepID=UPI0029F545B4|nr:hypothetical protein [uncultured Desulfobacter sp.]
MAGIFSLDADRQWPNLFDKGKAVGSRILAVGFQDRLSPVIISNADVQNTDRIQFYYQVPLACPIGDVDRDYDVDGSDLVFFMQQFEAGGDWMSIEDFAEQFGI